MKQDDKTNGNGGGAIFPIIATNLTDSERQVITWVNEAVPKKCHVLKENKKIRSTMTPKELFYNSMCSAILAFHRQLSPDTVSSVNFVVSSEAMKLLDILRKSGEFFDQVFREINAPRDFGIYKNVYGVLDRYIKGLNGVPEDIKKEVVEAMLVKFDANTSINLEYKEIAINLRKHDFFTLLARDGDFRSVTKESLLLDSDTGGMANDLGLASRKVFIDRFLSFLLYDCIEDIDAGLKRGPILDSVRILGDKLDQQWESVKELEIDKKGRKEIKKYIRSVKQDEQRVRDLLERQEIEARNRAREQQERAVREEEERLVLREFMAEFRPYTLSGNVQALIQIIERNSGKAAEGIKPLVNLIDQVRGGLDIRDQNLRQFGDILFSSANIATLAKAYNVGQMIGEVTGRGINVNAGALRSLSHASARVSSAVHNILQDPNGIILFASLFSTLERCKNYVNFTLGDKEKRESINNRMAEVARSISDLGEEMIKAFPDDMTVRALLERKAKIEGEILELDNEIRRQHEALRREVEQRIMGVSARRVTVTYAPSVALDDVKVDLPKDFQEEFALLPDDRKHFLVISKEYDDKRRQVKYKTGKEAFRKLLFELRAECAQHRENLDIQKELHNECGFVYGTSQDGQFVIRHPEYGIEIITEGDEVKLTTELLDARRRFNEAIDLQKSTLRKAEESGFKIEGVDEDFNITGAVLVSHEQHGEVRCSTRGYLTQEEFDSVHHLLEEAQRDENGYQFDVLEAKVPDSNSWSPGLYKTLILLDTNAVQKATATRGEGKRWLDLFECTVSLPNVAAMIIPEVVARFELQGRIPIFKPDGSIKDFIQADERYVEKGHVLKRIADTIGPFLDRASRAFVRDGRVTFECKHPKIIIWKTEGDEELYERIRDIIASPNKIARMREEIHHNGEGERAIMRVIDEMPLPLGAMAISDDNKFFGLPGFPKTTKHGMPIGWSGFGDYLAAEATTRSKDIRRLLGGNVGGKYFSPRSVASSIDAYWGKHKPDEYPYMSFRHCSGVCTIPDISPPRDMFELIKMGVEERRRMRGNPPSAEVEAPLDSGGTLLSQKERDIFPV